MKLREIRELFLNFFEERGHKIYESAPLIPKDPSILFTVAGMVPFKRFFLGHDKAPFSKAASSQVCIRTSDIDIIGKSPRHLTTFEMLGNFSFNSYFKVEAIGYGFEFITKHLNISSNNIIATVYKDDNEAYEVWKRYLPEEQIHKLGKDTNFWEVGSTGPCGPCSEVYYGFRGIDNFDPDSDDFIEIYNMVFMSYNKTERGLEKLATNNVDTGMGLERVAYVLQKVNNVFEIDSIKRVKESIRAISTKNREDYEVLENIIADHLKSSCFLINDRLLPSNEKQGYVLRKLLRRAMKYAFDLGIESLISILPSIFEEYSLLDRDRVVKTIKKEEEKFFSVLDRGIRDLHETIKISKGFLEPSYVFKLYDTYGFPFELTKEIAEERGIKVDRNSFEILFEKHRELSRQNSNFGKSEVSDEAILSLAKEYGPTTFNGYDRLEQKSNLIHYEIEDGLVKMVFDSTPFYAESGGQISDRGTISGANFLGDVVDVQKVSGIYVHIVKPIKDGELKGPFSLKVDRQFRDKVKANHSATHLLHSAAREVLGNVKQAGSLVTDKRLRLDLTIDRSISKDELLSIEDLVNREIFKNSNVCLNISTLEEAKKDGVIAFFEDRYGDKVRVVSISDFSAELCGGTHVCSTGEIGLFKIVSERAISSGIRRIEAVTREEVIKLSRENELLIKALSDIMGSQKSSLKEKLLKLIEEKEDALSRLGSTLNRLLDIDIENAFVREVKDVKIITLELRDDLLNLLPKKSFKGIIFAYSKSGMFISKSSDISLEPLKEIFNKNGLKGGGNKKIFRARVDNIEKVENIINTFINTI